MGEQLLSASEVADEMGFVYAIKCEAFVKIGWSKTIQRRLNQISANNPHPVELLGSAPGTQGDERTIQMLLWNPYREKGEWFRYQRLVVEVVENLIHSNSAKYTADWLHKRCEDLRAQRETIKPEPQVSAPVDDAEPYEPDLSQGAAALSNFGHG